MSTPIPDVLARALDATFKDEPRHCHTCGRFHFSLVCPSCVLGAYFAMCEEAGAMP